MKSILDASIRQACSPAIDLAHYAQLSTHVLKPARGFSQKTPQKQNTGTPQKRLKKSGRALFPRILSLTVIKIS